MHIYIYTFISEFNHSRVHTIFIHLSIACYTYTEFIEQLPQSSTVEQKYNAMFPKPFETSATKYIYFPSFF